jgi:PHO85 cyclin-6/7
MGSLVVTGTTTFTPRINIMSPDRESVETGEYTTEYREPHSSTQRSAEPQTIPHNAPYPQSAGSQASSASSVDSQATVVGSRTTVNEAAHVSNQQYHPRHHPQQRDYDQAGFPLTSQPQNLVQPSPNSPRLQPTHPSGATLVESAATSPSRIRVRNLSHIQSFASEEYLARPRLHQRTGSSVSDSGRQYEISSMPVADIIEMVAGLLTKITTTNDRQHDHLSRPMPLPEDQASMSPTASSVLAFHGKNVPSITILSYLSRINKYCPTTYEVFLSLLIYFDRMTETVNRGLLQQAQRRAGRGGGSDRSESASGSSQQLQRPTDTSTAPATGLTSPSAESVQEQNPPSPPVQAMPGDLSSFFIVDSFNIHRLVIAGVTCASKFFSDVFYTNSRYAKVCSPPHAESLASPHLNHLPIYLSRS